MNSFVAPPSRTDIPPLFDHQEQSVQFKIANPRVMDLSDPGCVDADTEYLTPTGWKRIADYTPGDLVAQFHPESGEASFVTPLEYVKKPCSLMLHFKTTRGIDQMLSPEHRVLYYSETSGKHAEISAAEVAEIHLRQKLGFRGRFATTFDLMWEGADTLTEPQARLQMAVMADGYFPPDCPNRCTMRLKKQRKKDRIAQLLDDAGVEYTTSDYADGFTRYSFPAPIKTKTPTPEMWGFSYHLRQAMVDESQHWDGCKRKAGSVEFSTRDKATADFVQFCAASTGRTATLHSYTRSNGAIDYSVFILNRAQRVGLKSGSTKSQIHEVVPSDGYKYCFSVPTTFLVLRRSGRIFATGNTGKSRTVLEAFARLKAMGEVDHLLVLAPLSILEPSWAKDCRKFTPQLDCQVVTAKTKFNALPPAVQADIYVTNHDSVKWLKSWKPEGRWALCVDEFTAYKHRTSQRSKAMAELRKFFDIRWMLSGTPNPNGVLDVWHPSFLCDDGERLGRQFWGFRAQVCTPQPTGPGGQYTEWVDKPHAVEIVADRLKDITFRVKLEECLDMPENHQYPMEVELPKKLMAQYLQLQREAVLEHESGARITAIHAGAKAQKLLQLCSGAVYDGLGGYKVFDTSRTDLALELVQQREHSVVAFNWQHQRDALVAGAERLGITYGVIDGEVPVKERNVLVERYQDGQLQTLFCQPQSCSHGLTFTRGTTTIWASPTLNAEHFQQFNRRVYRAGQTKRTETICIAAKGTREIEMYERLDDKLTRMDDLLSLALNLN